MAGDCGANLEKEWESGKWGMGNGPSKKHLEIEEHIVFFGE